MKTLKQHAKYWGLGVAILPFAITQALAQTTSEGNATTLDTVQVSGVRSSLQKSQIIKQDFIGTVDAVSSEDVGKFPDQNVADALQRVPGVSVDRQGGESRYITVRGFGPEFNTVLLNGRTMATESNGREFSFDILPSELISAAEVQKTSTAGSLEGSIGATVNIRTQRPLDHPGFHVAAALAGTHDDTTSTTKPKVSALISNTNANGTLGGLLSVVRYQRNHTSETASTGGWFTGARGKNGIAIPGGVRYEVDSQARTRTGANAALDWYPSERLKLSADAMYSRYELDNVNRSLFYAMNGDDIINIRADENNTATWFRRRNRSIDEPIGGILTTDHIIQMTERDSTNRQLGMNLAWEMNDQTTLDVDSSWSKAENVSNPYKNYFMVISRPNFGVSPEWNLDGGAGFPAYSNLLPALDTEDLRTLVANRSGRNISDELGELKTSLTRSFYENTLSRLQFGVSASKRVKSLYNTMEMQDGLGCVYCAYLARVPPSLVQAFSAGNVAGSGGPTHWLTYEPGPYFDWLQTPAAWGQLAPGGILYDPNDPTRAQRIIDKMTQYGGLQPFPWPQDNWKVREKTYTAFVQADFEGSLGEMPWQLNTGVRYIKTDVTSHAILAPALAIEADPSDPSFYIVRYGEQQPFSNGSSYHEWLPSLNFRLNLLDDLILRASASKTLTRPTLTHLRVRESIGPAQPPVPGTYDTGNVNLKPYTSKNFDLGLEWYMNDASYIALAGFHKSVKNFIAEITQPANLLGFEFMHTMPVNADSSTIKGAEFSFQYTFDRLPAPYDGLGMQLNYTYVESAQTFDPSIMTGQSAIEGLSDSANLVLFYEKDRFGIRAAWNWRDEYLESARGEQGEPTTVTPYDQLDLSTNFKLNDNVSIFADATNVTDERESAWSRYKSRKQRLSYNGRTMTFGIRGTW